MSAVDLSRPALSMEYTPLNPQPSISETKLNDEIPKDNRPTAGTVDFIANSRDDGSSW